MSYTAALNANNPSGSTLQHVARQTLVKHKVLYLWAMWGTIKTTSPVFGLKYLVLFSAILDDNALNIQNLRPDQNVQRSFDS